MSDQNKIASAIACAKNDRSWNLTLVSWEHLKVITEMVTPQNHFQIYTWPFLCAGPCSRKNGSKSVQSATRFSFMTRLSFVQVSQMIWKSQIIQFPIVNFIDLSFKALHCWVTHLFEPKVFRIFVRVAIPDICQMCHLWISCGETSDLYTWQMCQKFQISANDRCIRILIKI